MKNFLISLVAVSAALPFTAFSLTLPVAEDTSTASAWTLEVAAGKASTLPVTATRSALVGFDVSAFSGTVPSARVVSARLVIYLSTVAKPGDVTVHRALGAWTEAPKTAFAGPTLGPVEATIPAASAVARQFLIVDVTSSVKAWLDTPKSDFGFALATTGKTSLALGSKEGSGSGYPASLEIEILDDITSLNGTVLADGSVTSNKLASGSVGTTQLASGAVQSGNIASGAVGASQLANGAVGFSNLAKPPQAGQVQGSSLSDSMGNGAFLVNFPQPYVYPTHGVTPVVTLAIASAKPTTASVRITSVDPQGFTATVSGYEVDKIMVDPAQRTANPVAMAVVNGNPAIAYESKKGVLRYVRANDSKGTSWGTPVIVHASPQGARGISLAVVNGKPAISFFDYVSVGRTSISFIRATDENGSAWGTSVSLVNLPADAQTTLKMVNGRPAVTCVLSSNKMGYFQATDADGTTWGGSPDLPVGSSPSLEVVKNGRPAIAYFASGEVRFLRAEDADGSVWGQPVTVAAGLPSGAYVSLALVRTFAAIAYLDTGENDLHYTTALNSEGTAWTPSQTLDDDAGSNPLTLAVIGDKAGIAYAGKYLREGDGIAGIWGSPRALPLGTVPALCEVDGKPAFSDNSSRLQFIGPYTNDYQINWMALPQ